MGGFAHALTIGSLFSGIGGLELGLEWAGLGPVVWQVEVDPFRRSVLERHWPEVDRETKDVRCAGARNLERVGIVVGGFPCQDVSGAGRGAGLDGARSGLWWEFRRVVAELAPRFVVVENVESGKRKWLCAVRRSLHELGYHTEALGVSAADVGAPHLRRRIFVVAHADGRGRDFGTGARDDHAGGAEPSNSRLLADPHREAVREQQGRRSRQGGPDATEPGGVREAELGDTERAGREEPEHARSPALGGVPPRSGGSGRETLRGVGGGAHGLPAGLDGHWPAGRDQAQHGWEPPRAVAEKVPGRRDRLRALGDAVVPQCAYVVGLHIRAMLSGLTG